MPSILTSNQGNCFLFFDELCMHIKKKVSNGPSLTIYIIKLEIWFGNSNGLHHVHSVLEASENMK